MQPELKNVLYGPSARYFTETEEAQVRDYTDGLLERLGMLAAIERAESAVIEDALTRVMARYPQLARDHGADAEQRGRRDMVFVYRYAAFAFLLQDPSFIRDKVAVWMRTIILALMPRDPMVFGYQQMVEAMRRHLDERTARLLAPYVDVVSKELERERSEAA